MYMMIVAEGVPLLDVGGHVVAGWLRHRTLLQKEWDILRVGGN